MAPSVIDTFTTSVPCANFLRAVVELLLAVFAVVAWMQMKQLHVNWSQGWNKARSAKECKKVVSVETEKRNVKSGFAAGTSP